MLQLRADRQHTSRQAKQKDWIMRSVFIISLFAITATATAQIYQYTDAQGQLVFTDQPPTGVAAQHVDPGPTNSIPAPPNSALDTTPQTSKSAEHTPPYTQLQLVGLPSQQAIRANNGSFKVQVAISPSLAQQHRLQLLIDGQAYGAVSTATVLAVNNIDRGEHRLAVQVIANGQVIQRSAEQVIHVQRVHIQHSQSSDG